MNVVLVVTVGVAYCSFCGCVTSLLGLGGLDLVVVLNLLLVVVV